MATASGYRAVIYDCDGVMFDSFAANLAFYQRVVAAVGDPPLDETDGEVMRVLHTYANRDVLAWLYPEPARFQAALQAASAVDYRELVPLMVMEEGFRETLASLQGRYQLAVCTNRSSSMGTVLAAFDLEQYFACVMTASLVQNPKPHPEPLLAILRKLRLESHEALFVGDSVLDSQAAAAAGVPFVAYRADLPGLARIERHAELLPLLGDA